MNKPATWPLYRPAVDQALSGAATADVPPNLGRHAFDRSADPLLRRPDRAASPLADPPSLESILQAQSVEPLTSGRGAAWWRSPQCKVAGLAGLAVIAPALVGIAVVLGCWGTPLLAPLPQGRSDPESLRMPSAPTAFSVADANRLSSGDPEGASEVAGLRTSRPQYGEDASAPPPAALNSSEGDDDRSRRVSTAEPGKAGAALEMGPAETSQDATSAPEQTPVSSRSSTAAALSAPGLAAPAETTAGRKSEVAAIGVEKNTLATEVSPLERPDETTVPMQPSAAALPLPTAKSSVATDPVVSQMGLASSDAVADANSRIAAIESERDALVAKVARLENNALSYAQTANQSQPPAVPGSPNPLPGAPPLTKPGPDLSVASASLPGGMPARVLIRYAPNGGEVLRRAQSLANALTAQGVEVADLRESAGAIRTELNFSYTPDEAIAFQVGRLAGVSPTRRPQPKDALLARPGTVELSLAADRPSTLVTISKRERNHD